MAPCPGRTTALRGASFPKSLIGQAESAWSLDQALHFESGARFNDQAFRLIAPCSCAGTAAPKAPFEAGMNPRVTAHG